MLHVYGEILTGSSLLNNDTIFNFKTSVELGRGHIFEQRNTVRYIRSDITRKLMNINKITVKMAGHLSNELLIKSVTQFGRVRILGSALQEGEGRRTCVLLIYYLT